jgi:phage FluMu protein Com
MALVGTLLFCTACGDLLDRAAPVVLKIACRRCHALNTSNVPSLLRSSRNVGNRLTNSRGRQMAPVLADRLQDRCVSVCAPC